jgi:hypothetical protein
MRVGDRVTVTNKGSFFYNDEGIITEKEVYSHGDTWYRVNFNGMMRIDHPSGVSFTAKELRPVKKGTPKKDAEALDNIADLVVKFRQGYINDLRLLGAILNEVEAVRNVETNVQASNV